MKTKVHKMAEDEVVLLKSAAIGIDDESTLMVFFTYHNDVGGDKTKNFYRCDACYRTNKDWNDIAIRLIGADLFRFSDIGHDGFPCKLFYARNYFTRSRFASWLSKKLKPSKRRTVEEFNRIEFLGQGGKIEQKYLEEYKICGTDETVKLLDIEKLRANEGKWMTAVKQKMPRKKYGDVVM